MSSIKILAIVGSLKKNSINRQLALAAREFVGDRADFTILDYADVPMMNEDIEFPAPAAVDRVRAAVKEADGLWFFSPEHNHFFPAALKNLIDWLSRPTAIPGERVLSAKPAAVSGVSRGLSGTVLAQDHLVTLISFLNMDVMNTPRITIPNAVLSADGMVDFAPAKSYLERQTNAYMKFLEQHAKGSV